MNCVLQIILFQLISELFESLYDPFLQVASRLVSPRINVLVEVIIELDSPGS
jgi:hypothetical protein